MNIYIYEYTCIYVKIYVYAIRRVYQAHPREVVWRRTGCIGDTNDERRQNANDQSVSSLPSRCIGK